MHSKVVRVFMPIAFVVLVTILACNLPSGIPTQALPSPEETTSTNPAVEPSATIAPIINHLLTPSAPAAGLLVYDVDSKETAPERSAPYGDSYHINRLERPFLQDMSYVPDLDILTYIVASDSNWWYVSVELIGSDPNNSLGINYGVELDLDHDGFGDYLIWTHPPYTANWDTVPVQIYKDKNHNTGGLSGEKSDAPISTDGYETLIFNGGVGDADPDMAWVRVNAGEQATVQFAFKKSWSGSVFMLGVLADAGLKDAAKLDYVDRFQEAEAGSPVKEKHYYPLKALFAVDNACREAFGFDPTGYEPQLCPRAEPTRPPRTPQPAAPPQVTGCQPPSQGCGENSYWVPEPACYCSPY